MLVDSRLQMWHLVGPMKTVVLQEGDVPLTCGGTFLQWQAWLDRVKHEVLPKYRNTARMFMSGDAEGSVEFRVLADREETAAEKLDALARAEAALHFSQKNYDELKWKLEAEGLTGK